MSDLKKTFNCSVCEKPVPSDTGLCPSCGFQHAKNMKFKATIIVLCIVIFFGIVVFGSLESTNVTVFSEDILPVPEDEKAFINLLKLYRNADMKDANSNKGEVYTDVVRLRSERMQDIRALNMGLDVSDWIGTVGYVKHTSDGKISMRVNIAAIVALETWRDTVEDAGFATLIEADDPLFSVVSGLKHDDIVVFSGSFYHSPEDVYKQTSVTIDAILHLPTYLFKFKELRKQ